MKRVIYLNQLKALVLLSSIILSSCGMQGDLYLPEDNAGPAAQQIDKDT